MRLFVLLALSALAWTAYGQQPGHYTMYRFNKLNWNPAYAGLDESLSFTGIYRDQWTGLDGRPRSFYFDAHMPLNFLSSGIGLVFESDRLGAQSDLRAGLAYSFQLPLGPGVLSLGAAGGIMQRQFDGSILLTPDGNYIEGNPPDHQDPVLTSVQETAVVPTFQAGIYYKLPWLQAGLGVRNLTAPTVSFNTFTLDLARNFFFTAEAEIPLGDTWAILPGVLVRSDLTQTQTDLTLLAQYNNNIFFGPAFRGYNSNSIDAVSFIGGLNLTSKLRVGYAYDFTLSELNNVSNGSHEIMLNFNLNQPIGQGRPPKIIYNPRQL